MDWRYFDIVEIMFKIFIDYFKGLIYNLKK